MGAWEGILNVYLYILGWGVIFTRYIVILHTNLNGFASSFEAVPKYTFRKTASGQIDVSGIKKIRFGLVWSTYFLKL